MEIQSRVIPSEGTCDGEGGGGDKFWARGELWQKTKLEKLQKAEF